MKITEKQIKQLEVALAYAEKNGTVQVTPEDLRAALDTIKELSDALAEAVYVKARLTA